MKFLTILATLFATLAVAQNLDGQPACATSCIISAISAAGCGADDIGCQCGPSAGPIAASAGPCLIQACPISDLLTAESAGKAKCANYYSTATGVQATGQDNAAATTTGTGATAANAGTSTSSAGAAAVMTAAPVLAGAAAVGVVGVLGAM